MDEVSRQFPFQTTAEGRFLSRLPAVLGRRSEQRFRKLVAARGAGQQLTRDFIISVEDGRVDVATDRRRRDSHVAETWTMTGPFTEQMNSTPTLWRRLSSSGGATPCSYAALSMPRPVTQRTGRLGGPSAEVHGELQGKYPPVLRLDVRSGSEPSRRVTAL